MCSGVGGAADAGRTVDVSTTVDAESTQVVDWAPAADRVAGGGGEEGRPVGRAWLCSDCRLQLACSEICCTRFSMLLSISHTLASRAPGVKTSAALSLAASVPAMVGCGSGGDGDLGRFPADVFFFAERELFLPFASTILTLREELALVLQLDADDILSGEVCVAAICGTSTSLSSSCGDLPDDTLFGEVFVAATRRT